MPLPPMQSPSQLFTTCNNKCTVYLIFNCKTYLKSPTCFDATIHRQQGVIQLYQGYMPVKIPPYCMLLNLILLSPLIFSFYTAITQHVSATL